MKIAIMGAGIAGSYLYRRLSQMDEHEVEIFDISNKDTSCKQGSCAWGAPIEPLEHHCDLMGVDLEPYILNRINLIHFGKAKVKTDGFMILNKPKFIKRLVGDRVKYSPVYLDHSYELFIDATGDARAYLPKVKIDRQIPTRQVKTKGSNGLKSDEVYIRYTKVGYQWAFPQGNDVWHVGYGDYIDNYSFRDIRNTFFGGFIKEFCRCSASIRMTPPSMCLPFSHKKVVGVGEAIGTVSPLTGEGIEPSLRCAELLLGNLKTDSLLGRVYEYEVLESFKDYDYEYNIISYLLNGPRWKGMLRIPKALRMGERFGMKFSRMDLMRVAWGMFRGGK